MTMGRTGIGSPRSYYDEDSCFTEEYQEDLYRRTLWILSDFHSPRLPQPNIQEGWNRKVLIGQNGEKKDAFVVLKEFYDKQAAISLGAK